VNSSTRANFLPNQQFVQLRPILQDHLTKIANAITPSNFVSICDRVALQLLQNSFEQVRASEGSIWLLDSAKHSEARNLVAAYNTGPNAKKIQGFKQPLNKGIVSLTLATEQAFVENNVYKNAKYSPILDRNVGRTTHAMIVVPLYFLNQVRGVISCVQLLDVLIEKGKVIPIENPPSGFTPSDLGVIETTAAAMRNLIDYRLVDTTIGWTRH
jgi:hypothetical protein